jgi:hypothetical protein
MFYWKKAKEQLESKIKMVTFFSDRSRSDCFLIDSIRFDSIRFDSIRFDSIRLDWIRLDWIGLDSIRLDWIRLDWIGLDWIGFDSIRFDSIRFDSIRFDWIRSSSIVVCVFGFGSCSNVNERFFYRKEGQTVRKLKIIRILKDYRKNAQLTK